MNELTTSNKPSDHSNDLNSLSDAFSFICNKYNVPAPANPKY